MDSKSRYIYYLLGGFSIVMIALIAICWYWKASTINVYLASHANNCNHYATMRFMEEQPYTVGDFDNDREISCRDEIHDLKNKTRKREGFEYMETFDKVLDGLEISDDETVQIKDYNVEDYIQYEICSTYFYEDGNTGYELVIAQVSEEDGWVREAKVFVSEKVNDIYYLKEVLHNENHDGAAWDSKGLYLVDVNFDGEKDILVQKLMSKINGYVRAGEIQLGHIVRQYMSMKMGNTVYGKN